MSGVFLDREIQDHRAGRACEGLTFPADVKPGAVKDLVDAAAQVARGFREGKPQLITDVVDDLNAALRNLGIKESPR